MRREEKPERQPDPEYRLISGRWTYRDDSPAFLVRYVLAGRVRHAYARGAFSDQIHAAVISNPRVS